MKSIRLLPVVIFVGLALLLFKGIGLVTNGGYVLTGTAVSVASEEAASTEGGNGTTMALPADAMMTDTSPTMTDPTPTLAAKPEAASESAHGGDKAPAEGDAAAGSADAASHELAPMDDSACPTSPPPAEPAAPTGHENFGDKFGNAMVQGCPDDPPPLNAQGDALPTTKNGLGRKVPLGQADGSVSSEDAIVARLSERRTELDKREAELNMRLDLVAAAEKKIDERTAALTALETQINALVDQKKVQEDAQFKSLLAMYQTMKAKDAARIFDQLDIKVLQRIAINMDPRRMSPILAAMAPVRAKELTSAMGTDQADPTISVSGENLAQLPQIVGQ